MSDLKCPWCDIKQKPNSYEHYHGKTRVELIIPVSIWLKGDSFSIRLSDYDILILYHKYHKELCLPKKFPVQKLFDKEFNLDIKKLEKLLTLI